MPYVPENKQNTTVNNEDRSALGKLYPQPKTYEDRAKDQADREARILKRIPRHLALNVAMRLFIVVTLGVFAYTFTPAVVAWNVISGAFNVVLLALLLMAIIKWQAGELSIIFDRKGLNGTAFLTLYWIVIAPFTAVALYFANSQSDMSITLVSYPVIFLLQYVCIGAVIAYMSRAQL